MLKNIDKLKAAVGETIYNHIASLNTEQLQNMKKANNKEINNVVSRVYPNPTNEYYSQLINESHLINYFLS